MLEYHKTTEEEKRLICGWRYEGEYAVYNVPSYEEQKEKHRGFANPKNDFYSFYDGSCLIAYVNLIEESAAVFLGITVHPDCCGRGYGPQIVRIACGISRRRYPKKRIRLEVRAWNMRAVRCYEKAGFHIVGETYRKTAPGGEDLFCQMEAD